MTLITKSVKGTIDILPKDSYKYRFIENILKSESEIFGFKEIRTPSIEHTELFERSVGSASDVVQKEMYTFNDKAGRSITLRPEGTAGIARAVIENGLYNEGLPIKTYYISSCFRYEKPQSGRFREFHQFGAEIFGSTSPFADADLIRFVNNIFNRIGVKNLSIQINSIGCVKCRKEYENDLKMFLKNNESDLCDLCNSRIEKNTMRVLDCKNPKCNKIVNNSPIILDYLCNDCMIHFQLVQKYLKKSEIEYVVNPKIVRGLDYYSKTVFEFISNDLGSNSAICGGGRYDNLIKELSSLDIPSLGFGLGIERLMMLLELQKIEIPNNVVEIYIATLGEKSKLEAFDLCGKLRKNSICSEYDISGKSLKAQLKYANKINAKFCIVLGDEEIKNGKLLLKNMFTSKTYEILKNQTFFDGIYSTYLNIQSEQI